MDSVSVLGPRGSFQTSLPGYEVRAGQLEMAGAVEKALREDRILLCEAGTGTGKTLAYLVPALASGKRVIVSTATRALSEQIFYKDVPLIEQALGRSVSAALMKGLRNYLCLRRFHALAEQTTPVVNTLRLRLLDQWYRESDTGDFSELAGIPEDDPLLSLVNSSSETRVGSRCAYYEECFVTRMKRQADAAQLVIVNHHLFFADLALRGAHPARVLPNYDAVIFDEAHQIEDVATLFFGVRVSEGRIASLTNDAKRAFQKLALQHGTVSTLPAQVDKLRAEFFQALRRFASPSEPRVPLERDVWSGALYRSYLDLDASLDSLESEATQQLNALELDDSELSQGLDVVVRRSRAVREALASVVDTARGRVTWLDADERSLALSSCPVDIGDILRERVFRQIPSVVLTSATLTSVPSALLQKEAALPELGEYAALYEPAALESAPLEPLPGLSGVDEHRVEFAADEELSAKPPTSRSPFAFLRSRLGIDVAEREVDELVVPSPFDFKANALLYLPRDLPIPKDVEFHPQLAERVKALVVASGGGAFVLTTSFRTLHALRQSFKHPETGLKGMQLLVQGETSKQSLLTAFRTSGKAVLLATQSFWEGVDVPGNALRLVILEKLPFPAPSDPLFAARARAVEEAGGNSFEDLSVPAAQMALKQGFGRLIRNQTDRGVVALMDSRVHRRGYGQRVLAALPAARRTTDLEETLKFLRTLSSSPDAARSPARGRA